jgi:hypothetical protein
VGEWLGRRIGAGVYTRSIARQSIRRSCNRKVSIISAFVACLYKSVLHHMSTCGFFDRMKTRQVIFSAPNKVYTMFRMMDAISESESNLTPSLFAIPCIAEDNDFVCDLDHPVRSIFVSANDNIIEIFTGGLKSSLHLSEEFVLLTEGVASGVLGDLMTHMNRYPSLIAIKGYLCYLAIVAWCIVGDAVVFVSNILHGACVIVFTGEPLLLPLLFVTRTIELIGQPSTSFLFRRGIDTMKTKAFFICYLLIVICYSWNENQGGRVAGDNRHKTASTQSREQLIFQLKSDYDTLVKPCRSSRDTIIGTTITFLLYFNVGWEFCMVLAMPSKKEKEKKEITNDTHNEDKGMDHRGTDFQTLVDKQQKRRLATGQALEHKLPIEAVKQLVEKEQIVDLLSSKMDISERDNQTLKNFNNFKEQSSRLLANSDEETQQQQGKTTLCQKPDPRTPPPGFFRMRRLKQRKEARLRRKKIDPPPGFYRMRELKRQKELTMRLQQKVAPPPGFEFTRSPPLNQGAKATSNRRLNPNRKRRSKSRTRRPQHHEEIINGEITDKIPENFAVYLGSPSHNKRVQKFQEMFHEEKISTRVRKFLF